MKLKALKTFNFKDDKKGERIINKDQEFETDDKSAKVVIDLKKAKKV